jgi:hypothetical protein
MTNSRKSPTREESAQYMIKIVPRTFPDKNILSTRVNGIKMMTNSFKTKKLMGL